MRYWDIVERKGRDFNLRYAKKWKQYLNVDSVVKRSKICYLINWVLQNYLYDDKNTFYLRAGSLHRKYQKNSFFKGYIHLEWMTIVLINICVYPNNRKIWLYYESVDVNEINSKYDDPPVILQALDNIRFIYFILSNPSRIYDNGVSKYLCIRLVMTSDFPRCEHKWK